MLWRNVNNSLRRCSRLLLRRIGTWSLRRVLGLRRILRSLGWAHRLSLLVGERLLLLQYLIVPGALNVVKMVVYVLPRYLKEHSLFCLGFIQQVFLLVHLLDIVLESE
jgi:hypothetical protein